MSSDDETPSPPGGSRPSIKQRRPQRSCDICRQRKIRCDGAKMQDGRCSNCLSFGSSCTYEQPAKKRGPKNQVAADLVKRNAFLEAQLRNSICSLCSKKMKSQAEHNGASSDPSVFNSATKSAADIEQPALDDELVDQFTTLCIQAPQITGDKFFGSSSSFVLYSNAIAVKEEYTGQVTPRIATPRNAKLWEIQPWELEEYMKRPRYVYPPSDLITALLDLYFTHVHPFFPILHRPSFERSVADGLHLRNIHFGGTLLAALAIASRYSDDPRVFVDPDAPLSAGWKFIQQVQVVRKLFDPSLYDVQFYCIITLFYLGSSAPQSTWLYLGLGIRSIQQRGQHRRNRKLEDGILNPEDELWRRAFWSILSLDRLMSFFLGRPAGIHTEDYDVKFPLEVDDEYWKEGAMPSGVPSLLSYFVCHLRLSEILGDALRRLYPSHKSRIRMGWTSVEWEQRAVAELDSAMNDWLDTVPAHLRWDPNRTPDIFFKQSAVLYTTYHSIQIAIHRPYIHQQTVLSPPSLSICTSAARSSLHIAGVWLEKVPDVPLPYMMNPVFVSGVVLLISIFRTKHSGQPIRQHKDYHHAETALKFHQRAETRWQPAGRVAELLHELMSLDEPLPLTRQPKNDHPSAKTPSWAGLKTSPTMPALPLFPLQPGYASHSAYTLPNGRWQGFDQPPSGSGIDIQQLLADTAQFDTANLAAGPIGNVFGAAQSVDDELMSLWMAPPTSVAGINPWDASIGEEILDLGWQDLNASQQQ
ncbi:fungal-specific transcription factor domain-containing protein [Mycena belliarum]|uniref:Fungal-specific transcription factor domain-containing protein n=1 Tax=Mycena belliarum TaxID=1033014 RepID=A0AAD6XNM6_9AGAR|nr:fungal-specific transcription factor domain-containing protein [Mycena belliae]